MVFCPVGVAILKEVKLKTLLAKFGKIVPVVSEKTTKEIFLFLVLTAIFQDGQTCQTQL